MGSLNRFPFHSKTISAFLISRRLITKGGAAFTDAGAFVFDDWKWAKKVFKSNCWMINSPSLYSQASSIPLKAILSISLL